MGQSDSTSSSTQEAPPKDYWAIAALKKIKWTKTPSEQSRLPPAHFPSSAPSLARQQASLKEAAIDLSVPVDDATLKARTNNAKTILYLAYGSNLAAETFLGKRGIRPVSQINVTVPGLVMTFDLPGLPYIEPCFANTAYRSSKSSTPLSSPQLQSEKAPLLPTEDHTNPCWPKGLVGVVYEVTSSDFAHIIATEGGGSSYQDVLVDCHALSSDSNEVPIQPTTPAFRAHTLFSPVPDPNGPPSRRFLRPDPEYAQPSARYLKLITSGADQHGLPDEYKKYLHTLQPYTITSKRQRVGRAIFSAIFFTFVMPIFILGRFFHDEKGKSPPWLVKITGALFRGVWGIYDTFLQRICGDGERTVKNDDGKNNGTQRARRKLVKSARQRELHEKATADHKY